jgi:glucose-6-phosphate 1-dehydrogenase
MADPCTYVIFGATGNLSRLKLMPALYHLEEAGRLPDTTRILFVGICARTRPTASITTWARHGAERARVRASPISCWNRCGTATTSTMYRSPIGDARRRTRCGFYDGAGALRDMLQST